MTIDNPDLRYLVGNDAIQMIEARKGMSDQEFRVLIKQLNNIFLLKRPNCEMASIPLSSSASTIRNEGTVLYI
jgi:hypothetical protein